MTVSLIKTFTFRIRQNKYLCSSLLQDKLRGEESSCHHVSPVTGLRWNIVISYHYLQTIRQSIVNICRKKIAPNLFHIVDFYLILTHVQAPGHNFTWWALKLHLLWSELIENKSFINGGVEHFTIWKSETEFCCEMFYCQAENLTWQSSPVFMLMTRDATTARNYLLSGRWCRILPHLQYNPSLTS